MIHTGDCIEVMAGMEPESVDAVVTDPPYGLEFMGKGWDKFDKRLTGGFRSGSNPDWVAGRVGPNYAAGPSFQAWCTEWGTEALRVTKPGGYLLAFGGTRTHHRLVCGLEDAGWIIRDELTWIYASGFPKGRANLKPAHEPIVLARKPGPLRPLGIDAARIGTDGGGTHCPDFPEPCSGHAGHGRFAPTVHVQSEQAGRWPSNVLLSDPELFDEPNPEVVGSGATDAGGGFGVRGRGGNVYGDGAGYTTEMPETGQTVGYGDTGGYSRFFIIPKSARADREPIVRGTVAQRETEGRDFASGTVGDLKAWPDGTLRTRVGTARQIRENAHPTVKPVDLMRHLIRLVTPTGGTVLDCFAGSGSTLIAAELEGFPWVGIEKEPEYVAIAEARLNGTQRGLGLDVGAPTRKAPNTHPDLSKHQPKRRAPHQDGTIYGGGWIGTDDEEPAA